MNDIVSGKINCVIVKVLGAGPVNAAAVNVPHHAGGIFVNEKMIFVLRVPTPLADLRMCRTPSGPPVR